MRIKATLNSTKNMFQDNLDLATAYEESSIYKSNIKILNEHITCLIIDRKISQKDKELVVLKLAMKKEIFISIWI